MALLLGYGEPKHQLARKGGDHIACSHRSGYVVGRQCAVCID